MADWITGFIDRGGYFAIAGLMFLENLFPPIPSEIVMPLAGFTATQGKLHIALVTLAGFAGSFAGALFWYGVGVWVGTQRLRDWAGRHGRWLTLSPEDVDRADCWFDRHGGKAVFFGRLVPAVRTLISVPAGLSEMTLRRFSAYTAAGTAIWTAFLAGAGYILGRQYEQVAGYMGPVSNVVIGLLVAWYLWRVATFGSDRRTL